jgi:cilia- and flagella-associated protein 57
VFRRHVFGVKANVKDGLHFVDDSILLYPAGHHVVKYAVDTRLQEFINGSETSRGITAVALSPTKA